MLDLDYSDSDASDSEQKTIAPVPAPAPTRAASPPPPTKLSGLSALLPKPKSRKHKDPTADKDAPKKIVVNLPKFDQDDEDGRPAKKARTGGTSGLSALLPAPKRSGAAKREVDALATTSDPVGHVKDTESGGSKDAAEQTKSEIKATGASNTMFVPQSVARKPIQPMSAFRKKGTVDVSGKPKAEPSKLKVSLFGSATTVASNPRSKATSSISAGEYKPIMLEVAKPIRKPQEDTEYLDEDPGFDAGSTASVHQGSYTTGSGSAQPQDLVSLAREAGLDQNAMRQLYGRHGPGKEPIKFATFSVDEEYKQNERDRELGLAQEVKPVRTVAPGRHQLQSLLNVAQSQRGALEESFARGKSNRKEAASRYGW
ncbi:hypothetical protein K440DRAFT_618978 [Wilcoxina mikolae CBS 423.85]|nr:hypothetical protein K440DRAFT_618978 [Wilcoxina mikolae CBS 423.85]